MGRSDDAFWVFAYGSLMWRPGFAYLDVHPAMLRGYHRAFCIYSHYHRGTPERAGLVLGLNRGGCCRGLAFRVAPGRKTGVIDYLNERELTSGAYTPKYVPVDVEGTRQLAYTFVANRRHGDFAHKLDTEKAAQIIVGAEGASGLNRDYLINTVRRMESLGYRDDRIHELLLRVEQLTGELDRGSGI